MKELLEHTQQRLNQERVQKIFQDTWQKRMNLKLFEEQHSKFMKKQF